MKSFARFALLLSIPLATSLTSCKKSAVTPATDNTSTITSATISAGTWMITSYTERSENKTDNYSGINFQFNSDSTLIASGAKSASGTWVILPPSNGYYGSSQATLTMSLGNSSPFNRLNRIWNIVEKTASTIRLDNRETTQDEHITFSKMQ